LASIGLIYPVEEPFIPRGRLVEIPLDERILSDSCLRT
jgi:hypothetical protein